MGDLYGRQLNFVSGGTTDPFYSFKCLSVFDKMVKKKSILTRIVYETLVTKNPKTFLGSYITDNH